MTSPLQGARARVYCEKLCTSLKPRSSNRHASTSGRCFRFLPISVHRHTGGALAVMLRAATLCYCILGTNRVCLRRIGTLAKRYWSKHFMVPSDSLGVLVRRNPTRTSTPSMVLSPPGRWAVTSTSFERQKGPRKCEACRPLVDWERFLRDSRPIDVRLLKRVRGQKQTVRPTTIVCSDIATEPRKC